MVIYKFIVLLIIIFICLYNFFFNIIIKAGNLNLIKKNEKYGIISLLNKNKTIITVRNAEDDPSTIAEIIIQNNHLNQGNLNIFL